MKNIGSLLYRAHVKWKIHSMFLDKTFWLNDDEQKYLDLKIQKDKRSRDYHNILVRFFTTNEWSIRSSLLKIKIIIFVRLKFWWENLICGLFSQLEQVRKYTNQIMRAKILVRYIHVIFLHECKRKQEIFNTRIFFYIV